MTRVGPFVRRVAAPVLDVVRRGPEVAWVPPWMKLGNLLYVGLWAFEGIAAGEKRYILEQPAAASARRMFPVWGDALLIDRKDVKVTDRRSMPWSPDSSGRKRPDHFDPPLLGDYIEDLLCPRSAIRDAPDIDLDQTLVVNVRRGDYFTSPSIQSEFGIDTLGYSLEAVKQAVETSSVPLQIVVVSDDPGWCREHLADPLSRISSTTVLENDPVQDFAVLIHAQRLILPNSTFSYWGGYIGDHLYPDREVFAPWFFSRHAEGGRAYQLKSTWNVVENIPAGWDATGP